MALHMNNIAPRHFHSKSELILPVNMEESSNFVNFLNHTLNHDNSKRGTQGTRHEQNIQNHITLPFLELDNNKIGYF